MEAIRSSETSVLTRIIGHDIPADGALENLRVLPIKELRSTFGTERNEVAGSWRTLHEEQ
jgi:hypothetical protein